MLVCTDFTIYFNKRITLPKFHQGKMSAGLRMVWDTEVQVFNAMFLSYVAIFCVGDHTTWGIT